PALPFPIEIYARAVNQQVAPLARWCDFEFLITIGARFQWRTDECFANITFPQGVAFLLHIEFFVQVQLGVAALEAEPKLLRRPDQSHGRMQFAWGGVTAPVVGKLLRRNSPP